MSMVSQMNRPDGLAKSSAGHRRTGDYSCVWTRVVNIDVFVGDYIPRGEFLLACGCEDVRQLTADTYVMVVHNARATVQFRDHPRDLGRAEYNLSAHAGVTHGFRVGDGAFTLETRVTMRDWTSDQSRARETLRHSMKLLLCAHW